MTKGFQKRLAEDRLIPGHKYDVGRRALTAEGWRSCSFTPECMSAYRLDSRRNLELDENFCASCEEFPLCRKREARYLKKVGEEFRGLPEKSMDEAELKRKHDEIMRTFIEE